MLSKKLCLIFMCLGTLGLTACATVTEQALLEGGATRLNGEQAKAHLSGKTERWPWHETYYGADGKAQALWEKFKFWGTWEVSADGKVCIIAKKEWNNVCHSYVNDYGAITRIDAGLSSGVKETVEGKKLSR
ncbi:MAG: hypothetical protein ACERLB_11885 [Gammaproteobacteria bacterium]